jgi:hypothetical protein
MKRLPQAKCETYEWHLKTNHDNRCQDCSQSGGKSKGHPPYLQKPRWLWEANLWDQATKAVAECGRFAIGEWWTISKQIQALVVQQALQKHGVHLRASSLDVALVRTVLLRQGVEELGNSSFLEFTAKRFCLSQSVANCVFDPRHTRIPLW